MMFILSPSTAEQVQQYSLPRASSAHNEVAEVANEIGARTREAAPLETHSINSIKLNGCATAAEQEESTKQTRDENICENLQSEARPTAEEEEEKHSTEQSETLRTQQNQHHLEYDYYIAKLPKGAPVDTSKYQPLDQTLAVRLISSEGTRSERRSLPPLIKITKKPLPPLLPEYRPQPQQQPRITEPQEIFYTDEADSVEEEEENGSDSDEFRAEDIAMGLAELIRKVFPARFQSQTKENDNRKRKTNEQSNNLIKYRKVDNSFPKLYTNPVDFDVIAPNYPSRGARAGPPGLFKERTINSSDNFFRHTVNTQQQQQQQQQQRSVLEMDKPSSRKPLCDAQRATNKPFKGSSYTEQEYSDDDDEPEIVSGFGIGIGGGAISRQNYSDGALAAYRPGPTIRNVPIIREERTNVGGKPQPPRSMQMSSLLANRSSAFLPQLNSIPRPSYRDVLQLDSNSQTNRFILDGRGLSPTSTEASTSHSQSRSALASCRRTNAWGGTMNSVLEVQNNESEHREYAKLLGIHMPEIYGRKNKSSALEQFKKLHRRRSAFLVAKTDADKGKVTTLRGCNAERLMPEFLKPIKRPPLSSTAIEIVDDADNEDEDVKFTGVEYVQPKSTVQKKHLNSLEILEIVDDDDDDISIIEQENEKTSNKKQTKPNKKTGLENLRSITPVNTIKDQLMSTVPHFKNDWDLEFSQKWKQKKKKTMELELEMKKDIDQLTAERESVESVLQERLRNCAISVSREWITFEEPSTVEDEETEFIPLTDEHHRRIRSAINAPNSQLLITKFSQNITRHDIMTLTGSNWLNDEVINFYMNLLMERSELKHENGYPLVHAMNTFFIPRLLEGGYAAVKRWTRKVDIFSKDIIPVPVHVGNVHWCMAIIHLKNKTIRYYDSMGQPNPRVLNALEMYLQKESEDKRKVPFDTSDFLIESVQDVPRQENGSDCGVFSCMFAEYITRNKKITFTQRHMEYFRMKMILEIVQGKLLH